MSDAVNDTPESIERVIGEAITARSISIDAFSGIGPADLCCVTKQFVRAWLPYSAGAECLPDGYFHYCQGADVSCPAAISAYFQSLVAGMSKGSWYSSGEYRVKKAVFCVYDCFRHVDVRCEVTFPGCVAAYAVTAKGDRLEMQPDDWSTAFVSSTVRAMLDPPSLRTVKIFPLLPTPSSEKLFFSTFNALVARSAVTACDAVHGCCDASHNVIISTVMRYLLSCFRLEEVETLCARHMADAPGLVHYAAQAEVLRGNVDAACAMTAAAAAAAVANGPSATADTNAALRSCILSAQSDSLRAKISPAASGAAASSQALVSAIETAQEAARLCPYNLQAWLTLCKAYAAAKDWASMLITINSIPFHIEKKMGKRGRLSADGSPVQDASRCTAPPLTSDPSRMSLFDFHHGDADLDYSSVPSDLDTFPGSKIEGMSKEVYALVVEAMNSSSWDELLEIRSSVFLMKEEEMSGNAAAATSAVADEIDRSASTTSSVPDSQLATKEPIEASTSGSAECFSAQSNNGAASSNSSADANAEQCSQVVDAEIDPDVWRADLALSVATMLLSAPSSDCSSEIPDTQQKFRLSLDNFQAMLQTNENISSAKLKRLMKKVGSKSESHTAEELADILLSLSDGDSDDTFRSIMNGYRLHLVGNEKEELDSSKGTSVVTADSDASPVVVTNAVHAQASATSAPIDHPAVTSSAVSASPTISAATQKFVCKPWLDSIFMAIYGDLVA
jgi:hypothetical protein